MSKKRNFVSLFVSVLTFFHLVSFELVALKARKVMGIENFERKFKDCRIYDKSNEKNYG